MRRRAFLASALTATVTVVAGCGSADSRTEHTSPTVETDDRDDAKYLEFNGDGAALATVGVDPQMDPVPRTLFVSISHAENTRLESLTQRFAAPDSDGTSPRLSLQPPSEGGDIPHPPISLFQEGTTAVVEVDQFGELADESVFVPLAVTRWPESARSLVVESAVELVETGATERTHVLDGRLEFSADTEADNRTAVSPDPSG